MDTIKNYVETLFLEFPNTKEVQRAKKEILTIMEDHYLALLDEGKNEHEAIGQVISEFGSVDELREELEFTAKEEPEGILEEEMYQYLIERKKDTKGLSLGISGCLLAIGTLIGLSIRGAGMIGVLLFFIIIAISVGVIIYSGMQFSKNNSRLNDRYIPRDVNKEAQKLKQGYQKSFQISLVFGICLCVLSVSPIFFFQLFSYAGYGVPVMFFFLAIGLFLIIYGSINYHSFDKFIKEKYFIADEDALGPNALQEKYGDAVQTKYLLERIYWPIIVMIYLSWSFLTHSWGYSWLIFILAGLLYQILEAIFVKK
ncbi:permease prefix domain 1-containing protein [Enterococcus dongliensis]|uniref:permease prefix domain 1-containing protein n=1 Tax=Enterococcus dongliensis TaxID=2559925 RepID=UPI00288E1706|nr:permease prefix domain 1-containing protein [Enterococcus dongliensis]MDT2604482.1 permease prefix domain 1-containing protein [Enterococcus dongliensis]MDT2645455.1 permease prefix domain 1-containing protein [Enterococcus dongliensis]MDT2671897.1 permease prefix domain 1-containing protein [Enterococcus dongliensis]MDT2711881.1 permease prefix domain 1-containing protein [Enterococcus dongliensis]